MGAATRRAGTPWVQPPESGLAAGVERITPRTRCTLHGPGEITVKLAARLGVEPRQNESESFVLPLHHQAVKTFGKVEPAVGVEPTTLGLQNRCSTTELSRPGTVKAPEK